MAWRLYVIPIESAGTARGPKYFTWMVDPDPPGLSVPWAMMDYGCEPTGIVAADVTTAQHNVLAGHADVLALPVNLNTSPNAAAVTTAQTYLESINVPAGWVTTALTWRQIVRTVAGLFQFAQRYSGISSGGRWFGGGVALSMQWGQLPADVQTNLLATATSFGYSTMGLSGTTTIRTILKVLADAWGDAPFYLGGLVI